MVNHVGIARGMEPDNQWTRDGLHSGLAEVQFAGLHPGGAGVFVGPDAEEMCVAIADFRQATGPVDDPMDFDVGSRRAGVQRIQIEIVVAERDVLLNVQIAVAKGVESDRTGGEG